MEYRGLQIAKMLLFKLFWVQLAFVLIAWAIFSIGKNSFYPLLMHQFGIQMSSGLLTQTMLIFFGVAKFILYCVYLVPAIAIHWTLRCLEKRAL